jgi:ABC-type Fe3+ transport system substrate-binding protein
MRARGFTASIAIALALALVKAGTPAQAADPALVAAAQKEGHVTWYTTQIINQVVEPAAAAFEKKYSIHVDYVRQTANDLALRLLNEGRAGQIHADVFDGTTAAAVLKKEGLVLRWLPDSAARLGEQYRDKDGYWVATNLYVLTPGYNTELVPKGTEPRTFADLLDPKWKGKMMWNSSPSTSGAAGFIGIVLAAMGEDKGRAYLQRLAGQDISGVLNAARAGLDQVIAGETPIALNIFNNHTIISAAQGAPVAWIAMQPAMADLSVISVTAGAPHPNAGKLLVDFLASPDGQRLFQAADYIPVDPDVPPRDPTLRPDGVAFQAIYFTPEQVASNMPHWLEVYNDVFR